MKHKRILLYGQGNGRDHANHIALSSSEEIEVCSLIQKENALMEEENNVIRINNLQEAIEYAKDFKPDLVIISNRADLSVGATEAFRKSGFKVFGITKETAK